ncbi:MAG: hypothetical protein H6704_12145 [Myxococcales bacterium]|nr:hypothetical protein [Myxococcales bacterium]
MAALALGLLIAWLPAPPTVSLDVDHWGRPLGAYAEVLEDVGGTLDAAGARASDRWRPAERPVPSLGYSAATWWLRLRVQPARAGTHFVEVAYNNLDSVRLYVDGGPPRATGRALPFAARPLDHRHFVFPVKLRADAPTTLLLRVQTTGPVQVPVRVWRPAEFWNHQSRVLLTLGLYLGILLVMVLYNLFVFVATDDRDYLLYVVYVAFFLAWQTAQSGVGYQFLWPGAPGFEARFVDVAFGGMLTTFLWFTRRFLDTPRHVPGLDRVLVVATALSGGFTFAVALAPSFKPLGPPVGLGVAVLVLSTGVAAWRRRAPAAPYFLLSWALLLAAGVVMAFNRMGVLPKTWFTDHALMVGSALQVVVLSLALSERIRAMQRDKSTALEHLARSNAALERSNAELERFAYVAAHDLQSPLRTIASFVDLLELEFGDRLGADGRDYVRRVTAAAERMEHLIRATMDLSRARGSEAVSEPVPLDAVMASVKADLAADLETARCTLEVDDLPVVQGDPVLLRQVLQNLVHNAVKYACEAGDAVRVEARRDGEAWVLGVIDHGPGVAPEDAEKVFSPFWRGPGTGRREGVGMGLAMVRRIVERHGGRVWVEPTPGGGATFKVRLPAG